MSHEILDWADTEIEINDLDEAVTYSNECTDTSMNQSHRTPLKARQKLEIYWERKRLEENLYDVLSDTRRTYTSLRNDTLGENTAI